MGSTRQGEAVRVAPSGIWSVLATPFDCTGKVDHGALRAEVQWLGELGVRGVIANGVTSEAHKLSHEERCSAAETVRAVLPEGLGLVIGILGSSRPLLGAAAERARALRPDAIMVWAASDPGVVTDQIEAMQDLVADASGAPVIMQDAAFFGPPPLQPEDIAGAVNRSNYVCGVKIESPRSVERMQAVQRRLERPVRLIGGQAGRFMPLEYEVGARAFFVGPGFPDLYLPIYQELASGGELPDSWRTLVPLLDFMFQSAEFAIACYKRLLVARGVIANAAPRSPGATLQPIEEKYLLRLGHELGLM